MMSEESVTPSTETGESFMTLTESYRFCQGLFAYVFQYYKDSQTSELAAGLPVQGKFAIPDDFDEKVGAAQISVNQVLRPYLRPVFDKTVVYVCRTENSFRDFIRRRFKKLSFENAELSLLTICAILTEFNLYCFQRDCFRMASFAPKFLDEVIRKSNNMMEYLSNQSEGACSDRKFGFKKMKTYCKNMLKLQKKDPNYIPGLFSDLGKRFKKMKDKTTDFRLPMTSTMSTLPEGEEDDEEDETAPVEGPEMPPPSPPSPEVCSYCRVKDCSSYLQQFEKELKESFDVSI